MKDNSAEIVRLYKAGNSGHAISRQLSIPTTAVYRALKRHGVACRKQSEALGAWWKKRRAVAA